MDESVIRAQAMREEYTKIAKELTEGARSHIASSNFAVSAKKSNTGKPAYPINDKQHAASALGFAKMHHDSADLASVRAKIEKKFPSMIHDKEKDSNMGAGGGMESYGAAKLPTTFKASMPDAMGKVGGVLQNFGKSLAEGAGQHKAELAGLGILAVPSIDEAQAHARAAFSGDRSKGAVERRQVLPHAMKPVSEIAGLGVLAGPSLAHLVRH